MHNQILLILISFTTLMVCTPRTLANIHRAPIVIHGLKVKPVTHYPISFYRLFRTSPTGEAVLIPFQIDELNEIGDYVLDQGSQVTAKTGNKIFDLQDELVFMGDDIGPAQEPQTWHIPKPPILYEIRFQYGGSNSQITSKTGAVYLGIYFQNPPPLPKKQYVHFNAKDGQVLTSRYRYSFDKQNYLVVNDVSMVQSSSEPNIAARPTLPLIDSSIFYMKADLKYFLTLEINHRTMESQLEAFKIGPVRAIVRVSFFYRFLKLKFELGMYTEVSFFSNSVILPAVLYNPLNGQSSLNTGSGFYYGFALKDNPKQYKVDTNMIPYKDSGVLDFFKKKPKPERLYWISAVKPDRMMFVELILSDAMIVKENIPKLFIDYDDPAKILTRDKERPLPLGKAPINLALFFDMTKFDEGEHRMSFRLYFENYFNEKELAAIKELDKWQLSLRNVF